MPSGLEFALAPERLDEGPSEERAAYGMFTIRTPHASLTEGFDSFVSSYRPGPLVSGYHVAEWFAWNWWRLRWEPRSASPDWAFAHCMASIGEGYVWPNITISSDGVRTAIISDPSSTPDAKPFRYIGSLPVVVPSTMFEAAIDTFITQVMGRLEEIDETNLDRLWRDVVAERRDPAIAARRKLEALLGKDPNEADDGQIERLVADAAELGEAAVAEIAADSAQSPFQREGVLTGDVLAQLALSSGFDASPQGMVRLSAPLPLQHDARTPAWMLGAVTAQMLRAQEHLGHEPISDIVLAQMAGTLPNALDAASGYRRVSFALDSSITRSRIVLRSKWRAGRRFELARLVGDRLIYRSGSLHPATRAYTYRQKAQRSFAAELLCPFEAVEMLLDGDYSMESQHEVAQRFEVSELTVNTLLKNHKRLVRDIAEDVDVAAA